jgi:hypothetical protein
LRKGDKEYGISEDSYVEEIERSLRKLRLITSQNRSLSFAKGLVFMFFTKLLHSICTSKKLWLTSAAIAALTLVSGNNIALGDKPDRVSFRAASRAAIANPLSGNIAGNIYLYGETDRADIVGKEYIVFETIGRKTVGAFYLPQSEFSCFYGNFNGSKLNITLIDTYDGQKYKFNLALNAKGLTASKQPMMGTPTYQPLGKVSTNDLRILEACKAQLKGKV